MRSARSMDACAMACSVNAIDSSGVAGNWMLARAIRNVLIRHLNFIATSHLVRAIFPLRVSGPLIYWTVMNLLPKDENFFYLFERHAQILCRASKLFVSGLND